MHNPTLRTWFEARKSIYYYYYYRLLRTKQHMNNGNQWNNNNVKMTHGVYVEKKALALITMLTITHSHSTHMKPTIQ